MGVPGDSVENLATRITLLNSTGRNQEGRSKEDRVKYVNAVKIFREGEAPPTPIEIMNSLLRDDKPKSTRSRKSASKPQ